MAILDALLYSSDSDPQLRGQASLLASAVAQSVIGGFTVTTVDMMHVLKIINATLKDKETAACRLALQGVQQLLPIAIESSFCMDVIPLLHSLLSLSSNPYWLVKADLLEVFSKLP